MNKLKKYLHNVIPNNACYFTSYLRLLRKDISGYRLANI